MNKIMIGLLGFAWVASLFGSETPTSLGVNFSRTINGKESGVAIYCPASAKDSDVCAIKIKKLDGSATEEKVSVQKVREVVEGFFKRVANSGIETGRNTASLDFYRPDDATLNFMIQSPSRQAQGGFSMRDLQSVRPDRQTLLEAVQDVEARLTRLPRVK